VTLVTQFAEGREADRSRWKPTEQAPRDATSATTATLSNLRCRKAEDRADNMWSAWPSMTPAMPDADDHSNVPRAEVAQGLKAARLSMRRDDQALVGDRPDWHQLFQYPELCRVPIPNARPGLLQRPQLLTAGQQLAELLCPSLVRPHQQMHVAAIREALSGFPRADVQVDVWAA